MLETVYEALQLWEKIVAEDVQLDTLQYTPSKAYWLNNEVASLWAFFLQQDPKYKRSFLPTDTTLYSDYICQQL